MQVERIEERKKNGLRDTRDQKGGPDDPHQPRQPAPLHHCTFGCSLWSLLHHDGVRTAPHLISPSGPWTVVTGSCHKSESSVMIHRPGVCAAIVPTQTLSSIGASAS